MVGNHPGYRRLIGTSALCALSWNAYALPQGGVVAGGAAVIAQPTAHQLTIGQSTNRAVIDWQSFNIGSGQSVTIQQPTNAAILLNRIHDQQPSQIFGNLTANGQVVLANPNGMLFGQGSRVDVGGLLATTANISTQSFMNDPTLRFSQPGNPNAKIINEGQLTVREGGLLALVAPEVQNRGLIMAKAATVELLGADTLSLDLYGDGLLSFAASPTQRRSLVGTSGQIINQGGEVVLSAAQAAHLIDSAVNLDGLVDASGMVEENGAIRLAGSVQMTADRVTLGATSTIRADGVQGGGTVHVGGGWQGTGPLPWAKTVDVKQGATISASASDVGHGGEVVLWSKDKTQFDGLITANAGARGGDGGRIETSSKGVLNVWHGLAYGSATNGRNGEWLLDPTNITIANGAGNDASAGGAFNGVNIDADTIQTALNNGLNVTITTNSGGGDLGYIGGTGVTINKNAGVASVLTLNADYDINLINTVIQSTGTSGGLTLNLNANNNVALLGSTLTSTSGAYNMALRSNADGIGSGRIYLQNSTLTTNGGSFLAGGAGAARALGNASTTSGIYLDNADISAGGGNITLRGEGWADAGSGDHYGVALGSGSTLATTTGTITLDGQGGTGLGQNHGVLITGSGTVVSSVDGAINITGVGAGTGSNNNGVGIFNGALVTSTGTTSAAADITITGTGSANGSDTARGIQLASNNATISAVTGNITLTGTGGSGATVGYNRGIELYLDASILTTGTGAGNGGITLNGTGGGTAASDGGDGILIVTNSDLVTNGGLITLNGTANAGANNNVGINLIGDGGSEIRSVSGAISLSGTGNGSGNNNYGIRMANDFVISSTGTGASAASITLNGTGGNGTFGNVGIQIVDANTLVTSVDGDITLIGTGAGSGGDNKGINIEGAVTSTGTGASAANIIMTGIASGLFDYNFGIEVFSAAGLVATVDGDLTMTGTGGGSSFYNSGVLIDGGSTVVSTGTGAGAGNIVITGTGGTGVNQNDGIRVENATVSVVDGDLVLTGTGRGSGQDNTGVAVIDALIRSTGTGTGAGTLTLNGTGGNGTSANYGISVTTAGATVSSVDGDIALSGTGGTSGAGANNHGVRLNANGAITSTGAADIGIVARAGNGADADFVTAGAGTSVGGAAMTGNITINANKINLASTSISTRNDITVQQRTAGTAINLGTGAPNSGLQLDSTELGFFTADADGNYTGTLTFGNAATGAVTLYPWNINGKTSDIAVHGSTISFTNDIAWDRGIDLLFEAHAGDMTLTGTDFTKSGTGDASLTLKSTSRIDIDTGTFVSSAGEMNLILWSDSDALNGGDIDISNTTITTNGGDFHAAGGLDNGADILDSLGATMVNGVAGDARPDQYAIGTATQDDGVNIESAVAINVGSGRTIMRGKGQDSGTGNIGIDINTSAYLASTTGDIVLDGMGGDGTATNYGVRFSSNAGYIRSADGDITIIGKGGNGSLNENYGIYAQNGFDINSTGVGAGAAKIRLDGVGGNGTHNNYGLYLDGAGTQVLTADGAVLLTGTGAGSGINNHGILLSAGADITSTGTGATAATLTLSGTTGASAADNHGIRIQDNGTSITSVDGDIALTGTALGTGNFNIGILARDSSLIASTGTGAGAANISITGTGGVTAGDDNVGVYLLGTSLTTVDGDLTLTGTGGGTGERNYGLYIAAGTGITSTGTTTGAGRLTLAGTSGNAFQDNSAIRIINNSFVTSGYGDISVTGTGRGSGAFNYGVILRDTAQIASTGTGADAADITISGTGSVTGTDTNVGVFLFSTPLVTAVDGDIDVTGLGGGSGATNYGIAMQGGADITSTGVGAGAGTITLTGTGAGNGNNNIGVHLTGAGTSISSVDGNIDVTGTGSNGSGNGNRGVMILGDADITSTGTTIEAADILITGAGRGTGNDNTGIWLGDNGSTISAVEGGIHLIGTGSSTGTFANDGVIVGWIGGQLRSTGVLATARDIVIDGTTGYDGFGVYSTAAAGGIQTNQADVRVTGVSYNWGSKGAVGLTAASWESLGTGAGAGRFFISGDATSYASSGKGIILDNAAITAVDGDMSLTGLVSSAAGDANVGIQLQNGAALVSSGLGANAADIILSGTGGAGTDNNTGIRIQDSGTLITTVGGDLTMTGLGSGTGLNNHGIELIGGADITSTGTGAGAGTISLNGTGGSGTQYNIGLLMAGAGTLVSSVDGDVSLTGSSLGTDIVNIGLWIQSGADIISAGIGADAARLALSGSGSTAGTNFGHGVLIEGASTQILIQDGLIDINGTGGGSGADISGVFLFNGSSITSTGTGASAGAITLTGSGTAGGTNQNMGVRMETSASIVSIDGNISLTGSGSGSGIDNRGISLASDSDIVSTGTGAGAGTITLNGTSGSGTDNNDGVHLTGAGTAITSADGAIGLIGLSQGTGQFNYGINLVDGATIASTGAGPTAAAITLDGTGSVDAVQYSSGVRLANIGTAVTTIDGDLSIIGQGGGSAGASSYISNAGIIIDTDAALSSTGTTADAGRIILNGTGGYGTAGYAMGIWMQNSALVTSGYGDIDFTGTGGSTGGQFNFGIAVGAFVESTGMGANAADIIFNGNSLSTFSDAHGVVVGGGGVVRTVDGDIAMTGTGSSAGGFNNNGIQISGEVSSSGLGASAGNILVDGTAGIGTGVFIQGGMVTVDDGDITVMGQGNVGWYGTNGITMMGGGRVTSTGTGISAGTIAMTGFSNLGGVADETGILLTDAGTLVSSVMGDISLDGTAYGVGGFRNHGVLIANTAVVSSTGTGSDVADITITGNGGASGSNNNHGVYISGGGLLTTDGDVSITGTAGGGNTSHGVLIDTIALLFSSGSTADAGGFTLTGTGGAGNNSTGITVTGAGTLISSSYGDIELTGTGGAGGAGGVGVAVTGDADITATGFGATAATLTLDGTGGAGSSNNAGVLIADAGTRLSSFDGAMTVTGQGTGTGTDNYGIRIANGARLASLGVLATADVTLTGTGGNGTNDNHGVLIADAASLVTSVAADIFITGTGGTSTGTRNHGINIVNNGAVTSTGTLAGAAAITLTGTGGNGGGSTDNDGIILVGGGRVQSQVGDITATGIGHRAGGEGVILYNSGQIVSTGAAGITVGSSRVDLQACKLEYSIVSPK